jgi:hypothetical protein
MRVMAFAIATEEGEKGPARTPEALEAREARDKLTEELVQAGITVAGAGPKPPPGQAHRLRVPAYGHRRGFRRKPRDRRRLLIGEVKDMDEAVAWASAPNVMPGRSVMDIRPFYAAADLPDFVTPEELATREGKRTNVRRSRCF